MLKPYFCDRHSYSKIERMEEISYPYAPEPKRRSWAKRLFFWLFSLLVLAVIGYGAFLAYKIYAVGTQINVAKENQPNFLQTVKSLAENDPVNLKGYQDGRINILLLGIGGKGHPGQNLTDTIMIASLNTRTNQVALFSIPRDLYVKVPDWNLSTKINTVYQYGLSGSGNDTARGAELIEKTVEDLTSLHIDYYAVLDFGGFEKIIDALGGINIMNEHDIYDPSYPGAGYSYEPFKLAKGFYHMDGALALKYARERHNDPQSDFGRAKRQQQVMQAAKNKVFSAGTFLNPFAVSDLFNALGSSIATNVTPPEIMDFLDLLKRMDTQNINNVVLDAWNKDSLLKIVHVPVADTQFSALVPRVGNLSEIQELAQDVFDLNKIKRARAEIARENASLVILNESGNTRVMSAVKKLLNVNLDYKNVNVLNAGNVLTDKTSAYDLTNGTKPFTLNELATKLPAAVSYAADPALQKLLKNQKTDLVLVIGKDLVDRYNMEEGTLQDLNNERDSQDLINLQNK